MQNMRYFPLLLQRATRLVSTLSLATFYLLFITSANAVCPVCTVAIGAGVGLTRFLGVDDTISGVWIGGLILSSSFWLSSWLSKKNFSFLPKFYTLYPIPYTLTIMYLLTILPLWTVGIIGHPLNTILGIDKLIFGLISGSIFFLFAIQLDTQVRRIRGRQFFVYQKFVFPTLILAILSLIFYFLIK